MSVSGIGKPALPDGVGPQSNSVQTTALRSEAMTAESGNSINVDSKSEVVSTNDKEVAAADDPAYPNQDSLGATSTFLPTEEDRSMPGVDDEEEAAPNGVAGDGPPVRIDNGNLTERPQNVLNGVDVVLVHFQGLPVPTVSYYQFGGSSRPDPRQLAWSQTIGAVNQFVSANVTSSLKNRSAEVTFDSEKVADGNRADLHIELVQELDADEREYTVVTLSARLSHLHGIQW